MKKGVCWQAMPLAVAFAIVPDGGEGEDPEGDNDVDTAESDEEGGSEGHLFCLSRCVRWPVPGSASGTAAVYKPLDNTYLSTWLCVSCNPHLCKSEHDPNVWVRFSPELARSSEIKHDFVLLKHSGRCRSLFHSTLPL